MKFFGVQHITAIATEVFRKSPNGAEVIKMFERNLGTSIKVLTGEEEAHFGYQSALALSSCDPTNLLSWDCGAGSF